MFSLVYVSRAEQALSDADLLHLLQQARQNNGRLGVTGLLLYKDGNFMQLLEGERSIVQALYEKIAADHRHRNLTTLMEEDVTERQFPDWSMGFQNLKKVDLKEVPGYSVFLNLPLTPETFGAQPSRGQELLLLFRRIG